MLDQEVPSYAADMTETTSKQAPTSKAKKAYQASPLIAERIRAARIAANKTQQELADHLYSKSYISAIERAKMTPSLQALGVLAARLGVPVSYFFGEDVPNQGTLTTRAAPPDVISESERAVRAEAALLDLIQAEDLIRQEKPGEALEQLGDAPPEALPARYRPQWYVLVGWASTLVNKAADALPILEEGFRLAESLCAQAAPSEREQLAEQVERLRCFLGIAACGCGRMKLSIDYHRQCLAAIEERVIRDPELKLLVYKGLGNAYWRLGWHHEAIGFYQKAVEQTKNLDNERQRGLSYWGLGLVYRECGDLARAEECYREALRALGPLGDLWMLAQVRALLGQVLTKQGRYQEAEEHLHRGMETAKELGIPRTLGVAWGSMASLYNARGEWDRAIQAGNAGLQHVGQGKDYEISGQLQITLALAYEAVNDHATAEGMLQEAIYAFEQIHDYNRLGRAHERYGQLLERQGRFREAYDQMRRAREVVSVQREQP
jgi:tetratricopeptide (TPR) repeat protein